ncbi:MAG: HNH endonuclease [Candidatus Acidiferrum sp.]
MYCPYCGVEHDDKTVVTSIEHVIPYGLGGSDDLTIITCDRSNNTLGANVDAPFMDFFPVRVNRFFLGLESTKGNQPTIDLGGKGWINGKEVPISYSISADSKDLKIAEPRLLRTQISDGSEQWQVSGDPVKVREIIEGKLRKQMKLGKTITLRDGSTLRLEDLDKLFAENETVMQNPSVLKTIQFDYLMPIRFFSKLALAMGYLHFGETFSRSSVGETLRRHMTVEKWEDVRLPGAVWPETDSVNWMLQVIAKADHHVIAIMDGEPPALLVSLFGEYGAFLPLGELAEGRYPTTSGEGTVWRIELPGRKLSRLTMTALIVERSEETRRREREALGL